MMSSASRTQALIDELVQTTGAPDAKAAVRMLARQLIDLHVSAFGELVMPINVDVLASLRGINRSTEPPIHSPDAELVPDGTGGVTMRVNPDRPETRQRFSIAHEISHTFFPDYSTKAWCRTDARYRVRDNPDDFLEMLCDIGAAELLFPQPWFSSDAAEVQSGQALATLAGKYRGSREAAVRRFAELSPEPVAAVFFSWKLKPTQQGTVGRADQQNLFGIDPADELRDAVKLRIDYSVPSESFIAAGHYLPKDKSVENEGPIYEAAVSGVPCDAECYLDLGPAAGTYRVWAVPIWTPDDQLGDEKENAVVALVRPLKVQKPKKKSKPSGPGLFDVF